jgi:mono/diheme cytochrome c family protein
MTRLAPILAAVALLAPLPAVAADLFTDADLPAYTPDPDNGAVIFRASGCAVCHGVEGDDLILAGGEAFETRPGVFYAPNITHDPANGIGDWTDADFLNALMRGVSPEGDRYFGAIFPYPAYAQMRVEDALDLRAYLRTLPTSDAESRPHEINIGYSFLIDWWDYERPTLTVPADPQLARGQYLVEALGHCAECHTPRDTGLGQKYDLAADRPYEGAMTILDDYARPITASVLTAKGPEAFVNGAMHAGTRLNGAPGVSKWMRRIAGQTAHLSADDRLAMYAYLTGTPVAAEGLDLVAASSATSPTVEVLPPPEPPIADETGATATLAKVEAYCEAQDAPAALAPVPSGAGTAAVSPALAQAADQYIETYCRACHGPGKTYSGQFPTLDLADIAADPAAVTPGQPDRSPLYTSIISGAMPTGSKPSSAETETLRAWIMALGDVPAAPAPVVSAPADPAPYPRFAGGSFGDRVAAVTADINATEPRDRRFIRYLSLANMPLARVDCDAEGALRNPVHFLHAGVNKFINSISLGPTVVPATPVAGTDGAILRLDMRDYRWTGEMWDALTTGRYTEAARRSDFSEAAWFDLAERYPYAVDPASNPLLRVVAEATGTAVPIMRADWMLRFASEAPYYDMFLGLTSQISDLERSFGLDVPREIRSMQMIRAGMAPGTSGVSDHNRMLERFELPRGGYYWKSYDFAGDVGEQSLILHPDGPGDIGDLPSGTDPFEHDGGEMIFSLPNGLQGYYLSLANGDRLNVGPTSIVSFRNKPIGKGVEIVNARSCFDCHAEGIIAKRDFVRDALLSSSRYGRDQLDVLLEMYVDNDRLAEIYARDQRSFIGALAQAGATARNEFGTEISLRAPDSVGGGEIFTYIADMHFDSLTLEDVAREFHLDPETLRERARRLGDPGMTMVLTDWLTRLDAGQKIHRDELETHYASLLGRLTDQRAYAPDEGYRVAAPLDAADYEDSFYAAVAETEARDEAPYAPAVTTPSNYTPPTEAADKVLLYMFKTADTYRVGDLLQFQIETSRDCALEMFYIEENASITRVPQEVLGPVTLRAGERRTIPHPDSPLEIVFSAPGSKERMFAHCEAGGLSRPLQPDELMAFARDRSMTPQRAIEFRVIEQRESTGSGAGFSFLTFDVVE